MKKLTADIAENLALKFRMKVGLNITEPANAKTILRKLGILTLYRPLSGTLYGLSLKSPDGMSNFMLVNSNTTRGRQHFTVAHELYHLYLDKKPEPHFCNEEQEGKNIEEKNADTFASALLMPKQGLLDNISIDEINSEILPLATILRLEQYFSVSHQSLLYRLKCLKMISENELQKYLNVQIKDVARLYGYELSLYENGNENLVIGDFGVKARALFESGKISEGHYLELLKMISND